MTRNIVGARGMEAIETKVGSGSPSVAYPLYDTHGNMTATLSLTGSGTGWNIANERSYDVWGGVRSGAATGGPKGRYVANLGHVQDDESGLIYMRARYYEPESGRFVSEDPGMDGKNWYIYCSNDPINRIDESGTIETAVEQNFIIAMVGAFFSYVVGVLSAGLLSPGAVQKFALKGAFGLIIGVVTQMLVSWGTGPHKELSPAEFDEKMRASMKGGAIKGGMVGVALVVALYLGARSGLILAMIWEMDFVDNV
ncbi:MAG: RHS repeat-associated core domain-containing protein [Fimbriimonadaceae bacterium]